MLLNLLIQLWNDESGAIIATEYLMLGSIVAVGGASGMVTMRDSMNDEYKEFGQSVREARQAYTVPVQKGSSSKTGGSVVTQSPFAMPGTTSQVGQPTFSMPNTTPQVGQPTFSMP